VEQPGASSLEQLEQLEQLEKLKQLRQLKQPGSERRRCKANVRPWRACSVALSSPTSRRPMGLFCRPVLGSHQPAQVKILSQLAGERQGQPAGDRAEARAR
jgi:hypothetical protein